MKGASQWVISTFGGFLALMGVEHGIGEILQGSVAPNGVMIQSWPDSAFFDILSGEPAMTIIPNLLVTGILAVLASLAYFTWAVFLLQRKQSGRMLLLLSVLMLLVGGGIFPPVLGFLLGAAAVRLDAPMAWGRKHPSSGASRFLIGLWPWVFAACLLAWLAMFPGIPVLYYFFGVDNAALTITVLACMFGFLMLSGAAGFARDAQAQEGMSKS